MRTCDDALIHCNPQYFYYRKYHDYFHPAAPSQQAPPSETSPLLQSNDRAAASERDVQAQQATPEEKGRAPTLWEEMIKCAAGIAFTTMAGVLSWYVTKLASRGLSVQVNIADEQQPHEWRWDAQAAGWASALLYREWESGTQQQQRAPRNRL